jgi:aryl-alcohol dehydrogenase
LGNAFPAVLGHEGAGIVESVGSGVTSVKPGDRVLLTFNSCGECVRCRHDEPAYCHLFFPLNMLCTRADGSTRLSAGGQRISDNCFGQSSFAAVAIANERNVLKVSDGANLAILAPLGCGVQTGVGAVLRSLHAKPGEALLVIGGGAVGLSAVMGGTLAGCDAASAAGVDIIVDTSGHMPTLGRTPEMIAPKGRIGLVGVPAALDAVLPIPMITWLTKGGTLRGIVEGDSDIVGFLPELIGHYEAGRLPIDRLVTTYPFDRINEAIADAHSGSCIKPVLVFE